jgi:hypothetical protein
LVLTLEHCGDGWTVPDYMQGQRPLFLLMFFILANERIRALLTSLPIRA